MAACTERMAKQGNFGDGIEGQNYTAILNGFPELWAEILKRVPQEDRLRHAPLVSRYFSEICRDPSLWPELCVMHESYWKMAHWQSFRRWLAVRASGLHTFVFCYTDCWGEVGNAESERRTPELVALLAASAPQLRSLEHWYPYGAPDNPASALPAELGRLSQLTRLTLGFGYAHVTTAQVDAMVQTLPSLQHLHLEGSYLSDGFPISLGSSLGSSYSQLRCLEIDNGAMEQVPPELGLLTALTRLALEGELTWSLPDSISCLSRLAELDVHGRAQSLPPGLTACRQLTRLVMDSDATSPVLASLHSLRYLSVDGPEPQPPQGVYWTQLTALTELELSLSSQSRAFPAGLGGMTGLRKLSILGVKAADLPAGPYLSRLESLVMEYSHHAAGVPATLAAATQLRHLDIKRLPVLADADVTVLGALPALTMLRLRRPWSMNEHEWDERLAQLQAAFRAHGRASPVVLVPEK